MSENTAEKSFERNGLLMERFGDSTWVISGETRPHTVLLRREGASWNRAAKAWHYEGERLPARIFALLCPLLEPVARVEGNGLVCEQFPSYWRITGEVKPHVSLLRKLGARWSRDKWMLECTDLPARLLWLMGKTDETVEGSDLSAERNDTTWFIHGDTRPKTAVLKKAGASWDGILKAWVYEGAELPGEIAALMSA